MRTRITTYMFLALAAIARADFSLEERTGIVAYWADPTRYSVSASFDPGKPQLWVVRATTEGSLWFSKLRQAKGLKRDAMSFDNGGPWDTWIDARMAMDRWNAERFVSTSLAKVIPQTAAEPASRPPEPGLIPDDLASMAGNPHAFFTACIAHRHVISFDDGTVTTMIDQPNLRPKYGFLRVSNGILAGGQPVKSMAPSEFEALLTEAGITPSQGKVLKAVSLLEGGFDSVNTYDTGYVSIGLLQFTTGQNGNGALLNVLARMKQEKPDAFEADFRKFGVDVSASSVLQVVDPSTGAVLEGADATAKVIEDKRLTAVFQRAGQVSRAFRVAQLEIARDRFLPVTDTVTIQVGGQSLIGMVTDVIKSEAGLATLMDRKVNAGNIESFGAVLSRFAVALKPKSLGDLAAYEREIVDAMFYRRDFLADPNLTQPAPCPKVPGLGLPSRSGTRNGRGKG